LPLKSHMTAQSCCAGQQLAEALGQGVSCAS